MGILQLFSLYKIILTKFSLPSHINLTFSFTIHLTASGNDQTGHGYPQVITLAVLSFLRVDQIT